MLLDCLNTSPSHEEQDDVEDADLAIARQLWKNDKLLPPISNRTPFRKAFNSFLTICMVYTGLFAPLFAGFQIPYNPVQLTVDYLVDLCFWVDIILNFRTTFYDLNNDLVVDKKLILDNYKSRRLFWDLVANFPWELFALAAGNPVTGPIFSAWRLFRVLRFFRIKKLHPAVLVDLNSSGARQLVNLYPMIIHWVACIWWFIGTSGASDGYVNKKEFEGGSSWLTRPSFNARRLDLATGVHAYISALYWAAATLIKTAWIAPSTAFEKVYACVIVSLGAIMFAIFLGQFFKILQRFDEGSAQRRDKMAMFRTFCSHNKLSKTMTRKVLSYALAEWNATQGVSTVETLRHVSPAISGQLLYEMRKDIIKVCPLLAETSLACAKRMLLSATVQVCLKNEYAVNHNELVKELFILVKGSLQISVPNTRKGGPRKANDPNDSTRNSRASKKNLMQFRMLEKQGGICGLWNPFEKDLRYPYEVQAKEFTTMLNVSRQSVLGNLNQFYKDRPRILSILHKEYELVQNALRLPGAKVNARSLRDSAANDEPSSRPEEVVADDDDGGEADKKAADRQRVYETVATLDTMQAYVGRIQSEVSETRRNASSMVKILQQLGVTDVNTARTSRFSFTTNSARDKRVQAQNEANTTRNDEKREIVHNRKNNEMSGAAAAIVL